MGVAQLLKEEGKFGREGPACFHLIEGDCLKLYGFRGVLAGAGGHENSHKRGVGIPPCGRLSVLYIASALSLFLNVGQADNGD